jgi:dipeptidase D
MNDITRLRPDLLWKHFANICSIPHPSKHEQQLIQYIKHFAESQKLHWHIDKIGNIIVTKNATIGMSNHPTVILQSHIDMVPQKNSSVNHNFLKDPIVPLIDGEWVKAQNTTLGADNGIGAAAILAVLESDSIAHGPIEALFTIDEETGMTGALGLEPGILNGSMLLNLDTEEDGQLYIGCAGGTDGSATMNLDEESVPENQKALKIILKGLKGGHSGIDIHLGRGNAIKVLNRFLFEASKIFSLRISSFSGGNVRNAIPREASAVITINRKDFEAFLSLAKRVERNVQSELTGAEDTIHIMVSETSAPENVLTSNAQSTFLQTIYSCPNGVIRMSTRVEDIVETSLNLAIVEYAKGTMNLHCLLRSSIESARRDLENMFECALKNAGAEVTIYGGYPGWEPNPDSKLLATMINIFKDLHHAIPEVKVVHAGLECGIIGSKYPHLDMVSFGPTIKYPHSPDEKVHIPSVKRFWDYLVALLKSL